jgi:hypothetical protein
MDGQMEGRADKPMDGVTSGLTNEWTDGRMDG